MSHNDLEIKRGHPANPILDDEYIRAFDRMIKETREFNRQYDEAKRRRNQ
jgi:uncharacterized protein YqeY